VTRRPVSIAIRRGSDPSLLSAAGSGNRVGGDLALRVHLQRLAPRPRPVPTMPTSDPQVNARERDNSYLRSASAPIEPLSARSFLLAILVSILWGGNLISIRIGVDSVPPLWSAFWRMAVGVVIVTAWSFHRGVAIRPAPGERWPLFLLGVLFTGQIALLNSGTALTSPAFGVVILNSHAVFANLTGHFFPGMERPINGMRALGLALAVAGMVVLTFGQSASTLAPDPLTGNVLMVFSALLLGVRQVYTRWLVQHIEPARTVVWQMAWSVPLFLAVAALSEPPVYGSLTVPAIAAISYQGVIVAGICFIIWAELLKRHAAGTLSMFGFLVPITGIALSSLFFGEPMRVTLLAGGILVLAGVYTVTR
jgi:drug/metabolite transporter (DMT)-like permease